MENAELEQSLRALVKFELCKNLVVLTEFASTKEEAKREQQREIIDFINSLPIKYKQLPNRDELIAQTLQKMGMNTDWGKKKLEEINYIKKTKGQKTEKKSTFQSEDKEK